MELRFRPDFLKPIVSPPKSPTLTASLSKLVFILECPANLGLCDSIGRFTGHNSSTERIIEEIPNSTCLIIGESQAIIIFSPKNQYELYVTGTGYGNYTLNMIQVDEMD